MNWVGVDGVVVVVAASQLIHLFSKLIKREKVG